jgi:hypothetical protein
MRVMDSGHVNERIKNRPQFSLATFTDPFTTASRRPVPCCCCGLVLEAARRAVGR